MTTEQKDLRIEVDLATGIAGEMMWGDVKRGYPVVASARDGGAGLNIGGTALRVPYVLAQFAVPVCMAPSGTVATDGTVTLGTALPATFGGGIWLRLPADAVVDGAAGLYWAVMSSSTVGQVYATFEDPAAEFVPYIPDGALVAAVGSNSAYTQTTAADAALARITVPAGALGLHGALRGSQLYSIPSNANNKTLKAAFGGTAIVNQVLTTSVSVRHEFLLRNAGVADAQICPAAANINAVVAGVAAGGMLRPTVDTAADQALVLTCQLATATDYAILEGVTVEVLPC